MKAAELSVIVPTFNERGNIKGVIVAVASALPKWEMIFVDHNSSDGADVIRSRDRPDRSACQMPASLRAQGSCFGLRGRSTASPFVAWMDADRQHEVQMFEMLKAPTLRPTQTTTCSLRGRCDAKRMEIIAPSAIGSARSGVPSAVSHDRRSVILGICRTYNSSIDYGGVS